MVEEKKNQPPQGDFIDLEKSEFKKKSNIVGFLIKYLFLGFVFFVDFQSFYHFMLINA